MQKITTPSLDDRLQQLREITDFEKLKGFAFVLARHVYLEVERTKALKAEIDRLTRFIPVSERVPDHYHLVLVELTGGARTVGRKYNDGKWGWLSAKGFKFENERETVTGWREI